MSERCYNCDITVEFPHMGKRAPKPHCCDCVDVSKCSAAYDCSIVHEHSDTCYACGHAWIKHSRGCAGPCSIANCDCPHFFHVGEAYHPVDGMDDDGEKPVETEPWHKGEPKDCPACALAKTLPTHATPDERTRLIASGYWALEPS